MTTALFSRDHKVFFLENIMRTFNASSTEIKQFTTVYHVTYGKGTVVSLTPRNKDNLVMCFFPSVRCHEWELESTIRGGMGDITLTKATSKAQTGGESETLESVLRGLFSPN